MTDKQLGVLLLNYADRLRVEIERVDVGLDVGFDEGFERNIVSQLTVSDIIEGISEDAYFGSAVLLDGLNELMEELGNSAELLLGSD